MSRWKIIWAVVGVLAIIGAAVYAKTPSGSGPTAAEQSAQNRSNAQMLQRQAARQTVEKRFGSAVLGQLPAHPRVLFFGDSWTAGFGTPHPAAQGYAADVAKLMGWRATIDGVGGSGYVQSGPNHDTYSARAAKLKVAKPYDLIVVQGSVNDSNRDPKLIPAAAAATVANLRKASPGSQIVIFTPVPSNVPARTGETADTSQLVAYAKAHQIPFIDPIAANWIPNTQAVRTIIASKIEKSHPDVAGYQTLAHYFRGSIEALTRTV